jgi:cell wall-associated NlpC family hydrolase
MAGWSAVLSAGGTTELVRRAAAIQFVGQARTGVLARTVAAAAVADQARLAAEQALVTVTSSALVTAQARVVLLHGLDAQQGEVEALEREQRQLLAMLDRRPRQRPDRQLLSRETDGRARRVVAFALAQVGKPYLWAGAGPDTFDCSGLTMRAWERAGVALPHYSAGQAQLVLPVPWDQLRPGDLVFFAADPGDITTVYHVALYVGGGLVVEAPQPGTNVRVAPVRQPGLFGAGRPWTQPPEGTH